MKPIPVHRAVPAPSQVNPTFHWSNSQPYILNLVDLSEETVPLSHHTGATILRAIDDAYSITEALANCFVDLRNPLQTEHSVTECIRSVIFGACCGHTESMRFDMGIKDGVLNLSIKDSEEHEENEAILEDEGKRVQEAEEAKKRAQSNLSNINRSLKKINHQINQAEAEVKQAEELLSSKRGQGKTQEAKARAKLRMAEQKLRKLHPQQAKYKDLQQMGQKVVSHYNNVKEQHDEVAQLVAETRSLWLESILYTVNKPSKSTLNRFINGSEVGTIMEEFKQSMDKDQKIFVDTEKIKATLTQLGVSLLDPTKELIIIDIDATHMPIYGNQILGSFSGFYDCKCYLPLFIFCEKVCLWAQLRPVNKDHSSGTQEALQYIIPKIRRQCPNAQIVIRADSSFSRDPLMTWLESEKIFYVIGIGKNATLKKKIAKSWTSLYRGKRHERHLLYMGKLKSVPDTYVGWDSVRYKTQKTWSRERRVIAQLELLKEDKLNPRFVVTNIEEECIFSRDGERVLKKLWGPHLIYEFYCQRGEMENRFKEIKRDLRADRMSSNSFQTNQLRLWFGTFSYMLMHLVRTKLLKNTSYRNSSVGVIKKEIINIPSSFSMEGNKAQLKLTSSVSQKRRDVFRIAIETLLEKKQLKLQ